MHRYRIIDKILEGWVEGSFTNVFAEDFCGSLEFRRTAEEHMLAPGLALYLPHSANPDIALIVSEVDRPVGDTRIDGLPILLTETFRRGQTYFRRKVIILEDAGEPPRGSGCTF